MAKRVVFETTWLPAGRVASLQEAALWLQRASELLDGLSVGVDLDVPAPSALLMDLGALAGALASFVADQRPATWSSELSARSMASLARAVAQAAADDPNRIATTDAVPSALAAFLRDLPDVLRQR